MRATWRKHRLQFVNPVKTSRNTMSYRDAWFLTIFDNGIAGIGECAPLPGLSLDPTERVEKTLAEVCFLIENQKTISNKIYLEFPAIKFAVEMAHLDFTQGGKGILYDNDFVTGRQALAINGLIWMGSFDSMKLQIDEKIESGFTVIKLKVGSLKFDDELQLLTYIRSTYDQSIELRLDANGAFPADKTSEYLAELSQYNIHSIEQPIAVGQTADLKKLCKDSPIPIALDEELIPHQTVDDKRSLLENIQPQYIILKPSLVGGFSGAEEWISIADSMGIGWWATSALESNIGLNAIAQWTASFKPTIPQGLGTGQLYSNNLESPLEIANGKLRYNQNKTWIRL